MESTYFEKLGCAMRGLLLVWSVGWWGFVIFHLVAADKPLKELALFGLGGFLIPAIFWPLTFLLMKIGEK